jgi:alkylated DNA repair dioxygenase AlkB
MSRATDPGPDAGPATEPGLHPGGPSRATIDPDASAERVWLDEGSWVDVVRGWVPDADAVHDHLAATVAWQQGRLFRYERWVDEPRLGSWWRAGDPPPHPVVLEAHRALRTRYGVRFDGCGLARYRDQRDSVAFHRDRDMRWLDDTLIALVTLGARRPFLVRPRANRHAHELPDHGATHDLAPGSGDLLVMGGATQAGWEHAVPKVATPVGDRISLQWRWTSKQGRPVQGASYRAPRHFSRP